MLILLQWMYFSGSLDSEQTYRLYRRFKELVEANEQTRKGAVKPPSSAVASSVTSPPPNSQVANGAVAAAGQRESLLNSRLTLSNTSPVVSPLTGNPLTPRVVTEDEVASPRIGSYVSSQTYSNGPTAAAGQRESLRGSRLTSSNTSPVVSPLTGNLLAPRVVTGDDVASPGVGSYLSSLSHSNGPTAVVGQRESLLSSRFSSSNTYPVVSPLTGNVLVPRVAMGDDVGSPGVGNYVPSLSYSNGPTAAVGQRESLLNSRFSSSNTTPVISPLTGNILAPRVAAEDEVASPRIGSYLASSSSFSNGPTAAAGQRESLLSSRFSSSNTSPVISPLTGNILVPRVATGDDVASPGVGNYLTSPSYGNGPTAESTRNCGSSLSSPSSSRLTPFTANSSVLSRFDSPIDGVTSRVVNGGGGSGMSRFGDRSPDVAALSYLSGSRLDDASSAAARPQSLRDSYSSTMWNDSTTSRRDRHSSAGWGGVDIPTSSVGLSRLTSYDADPTSELPNGLATASSRYGRVMSARSRSVGRRGDAARDGVLTVAAPRTRITSPAAAARFAMNDLSDVLQSSAAVEPPASVRSTPYSASSRAERMKSYSVEKSSKTDPCVNATVTAESQPTSTTADILRTQLSDMTTLPCKQLDMTSGTQTGSATSSLKTSSPVHGTEMPLKTETTQTPAVDKSNTQRDTGVCPSTNSPKNVIVNGCTKTPEVDCRQQIITSSLSAGYTGSENDKHAAPTNRKTATSEMKYTASGATSSETDCSRKSDTDSIASDSLIAATLNRAQAAAAAAADAAVSLSVRGKMEAMEETLPEISSSEQQTTAAEHRDVKYSSDSVVKSSSSPLRAVGRARSRAPSTLQEMLDPSAGEKNAKRPSAANQTNDVARSGSGRKVNDAPASSSSKAATAGDSASKSASKGGVVAKSRSKMVVDVQEMLMPVPGGSGKTGREPANVASTSNSTTTSSRSRTSSTSSTTESSSGNVKPTKPSSQPPRRQAPSSDIASRSGATTADRIPPRGPSTSTTSSQANKVTRPVQERKLASKTTTATVKQASESASTTSTTTGENDWETTITGIIQASDTIADDSAAVSVQEIEPSTSMSSLQSEPPPLSAAQKRRNSASRDGLSSLMRPTASSMARRGSTSGASGGHAGYAAPTSSSSSKSMSPGMLRTTSSPTLRLGGALSVSNRPAGGGTASGRTTPTSPRRTPHTMALPATARATRTPNATPTRPGTSTTANKSVQRGAGQTSSRTNVNNRSRHNSSSSSSGDPVAGRK